MVHNVFVQQVHRIFTDPLSQRIFNSACDQFTCLKEVAGDNAGGNRWDLIIKDVKQIEIPSALSKCVGEYYTHKHLATLKKSLC